MAGGGPPLFGILEDHSNLAERNRGVVLFDLRLLPVGVHQNSLESVHDLRAAVRQPLQNLQELQVVRLGRAEVVDLTPE